MDFRKTKITCYKRVVVLVLYMLLGAVIFLQLEKTDEPNQVVAKRILESAKGELALQLKVNITDQEFLNLVKTIDQALEIQKRNDWTYMNALSFVLVSLTTIGYGDIVPRTLAGQSVFIIYAVIGIPWTVLTLKSTGEVTCFYIRKLVIFTEKVMCRRLTHDHIIAKCFMASFLFFLLYLVLTAFAFQHINNISYFEGFYATFVTASTIGFGDYTMDLNHLFDKYSSFTLALLLVSQIPVILFNLTTVSCFFDFAVEMLEKPRNVVNGSGVESAETMGDDSNDNRNNISTNDNNTSNIVNK
ncbi:potassium channel subfamily K member 15-like [Exaiptasia diaphana]|uniref:Potassium channel domain-containing protein n=1 Tax=Exaiptasia diaphana TaxID=2652724 RepID=A0A913YHB2_EXADI|nr:potassium channel subfamily K member 15-like [Exaiptasia diaphana]